jgi:hypothetical protein
MVIEMDEGAEQGHIVVDDALRQLQRELDWDLERYLWAVVHYYEIEAGVLPPQPPENKE